MKTTKQEVDYGDSSNPAAHRCGICEYYVPNPSNYNPTLVGEGTCTRVEGDIGPMDGCTIFSKDLIKWANDPLIVTKELGKA